MLDKIIKFSCFAASGAFVVFMVVVASVSLSLTAAADNVLVIDDSVAGVHAEMDATVAPE